jgi:V/A-type H+-transporting ATPase subunit I
MMPLIILAGMVGVAQVVFGLVLGIINGVRTKHMKHVYEKAGMLSVLGAAALFGIAAIPALAKGAPFFQAIAGVAIIGGIFFAGKGGGALGAIESILQFSNIASYLRIMAVGLAGAIFAEAVNEMAAQMGIAGIFIGLILHTLNILLAAFSPNIHALRLNFLEFFGKFYEAGKQQYSPFHKTGGEKSA